MNFTKFRKYLGLAVVAWFVLGVPIPAHSQDILEWPGHLFLRPYNPSIRFNGVLILQNTTTGYQTTQFGAATGSQPHVEFHGQSLPTMSGCSGGSIAAGSNDAVGQAAFTGCTTGGITFAVPYTTTPFCFFSNLTSTSHPRIQSISATNVTVLGLSSGDSLLYLCAGRF